MEIDSDCHTQKYLSRPSRQEVFSALSCQIKGSIAHLSKTEGVSMLENLFVRDMIYNLDLIMVKYILCPVYRTNSF